MAAIAGGLLASPRASEAQRAKVYRIGLLSTGNPRSSLIFQAFEEKVRELGYAEGQNLIIEFRYAEGRTERLPGLAAELIRLNVEVVVVASDRGSQL